MTKEQFLEAVAMLAEYMPENQQMVVILYNNIDKPLFVGTGCPACASDILTEVINSGVLKEMEHLEERVVH